MYENLRKDFIVELDNSSLGVEEKQIAVRSLDHVAADYSIGRKEANLVTFEYVNAKLLDYYLACKSVEGFSAKTLRQKKYALELFLKQYNKPVDEITALDIRFYMDAYQKERKISNRSLEGLRHTLQAFFVWCVEEDYLGKNPMIKIKPIKFEAKQRQSLDPVELEYLRRACETARERAMVDILYSTGCRCSELCGMKVAEVDWNDKSIMVTGKGNKQRPVYFNAAAVISLRIYLDERKELESKGEEFEENIFTSENIVCGKHRGLTANGALKVIKRIASRTGDHIAKRVFPHLLRHTAATTALRNGMPVEVVKEMLGHERVDTTLVYAKVAQEEVKRMHDKCLV